MPYLLSARLTQQRRCPQHTQTRLCRRSMTTDVRQGDDIWSECTRAYCVVRVGKAAAVAESTLRIRCRRGWLGSKLPRLALRHDLALALPNLRRGSETTCLYLRHHALLRLGTALELGCTKCMTGCSWLRRRRQAHMVGTCGPSWPCQGS